MLTVLVQTTNGNVKRTMSNRSYLWYLTKKPNSVHLLINEQHGPAELDSFITEACNAVDKL
jgi:hypothetical protein